MWNLTSNMHQTCIML